MRTVRVLRSIGVVMAVLLAYSGFALAAETVDFSSGSAALSMGSFNVSGDNLTVKIAISDLKTNGKGDKQSISINGFNDVVKNLKFSSFTAKVEAEGIDTKESSLAVSTGFIPITLGNLDKLKKGMTIDKSTSIAGIKLLDMINELSSISLDIVPTAKDASLTIDIIAKVTPGASIEPNIKLSGIEVDKMEGNPTVSVSLSSGENNTRSKAFVLKVTDKPSVIDTPSSEQTSVPTFVPTETSSVATPTSTASQNPTVIPTTTSQSPVPVLGILAGCIVGFGVLSMRKKNN